MNALLLSLKIWAIDMGIRFAFKLEDKDHSWADKIIMQCNMAKEQGLSLYEWRKKHSVDRRGYRVWSTRYEANGT